MASDLSALCFGAFGFFNVGELLERKPGLAGLSSHGTAD
jgi:hypothetical protein